MTNPGTFSAAAVIFTVMTSSAAAQPVSGAANPRGDHVRGWSVSAGYEEFALRDVSRNMRPVDASPVRWIGTGPVVGIRHDRRGAKALHSVTASVAVAQNFIYRSFGGLRAARDGDLSQQQSRRTRKRVVAVRRQPE